MPYKEREIERLFYSIGDVATILNVSTSLIRFWEKEFPMLKPRKTQKGNRQYSAEEIELLKKIYTLVRVNGFTLDGARKALQEKQPGTITSKDEALIVLRDIRERIQQALNSASN